MSNVKTRYSKNPDKLNRKNTLVTISEGNTIFFGISRCNVTAGDKFLKAKGQMVAEARAEKAITDFANLVTLDTQADGYVDDLTLHFSGLRGFISKEKVPALLEYFRNIDKLAHNPRSEDFSATHPYV